MYRIVMALGAMLSCVAMAQEPGAVSQPRFTLERALTLATNTAPSLDAAAAGLRAADAAHETAGLLPNPSFAAMTENVGGTGAYRATNSAETTVGLEIPIELGGKRAARVEAAQALRGKARIDAAQALADVTLRVTAAYIEAAAADLRIEVARQQVELARETQRAARVRVTAGSASPIEQQRADVLMVKAETSLTQALRTAAVTRESLGKLIGQPVGGPLDLDWLTQLGPETRDAGYGTEDSLLLASADADVAAADAEIGMARANSVPDVTFSASARRLAATNDTAAVFGISIPLPVFNSGSSAISQARAERDRAAARRRDAQIEAEREIAGAKAEIANAVTAARAATGPALGAAKEAARVARLGYTQGKFGQLDLLDAERTLTDTQLSAVDALSDYRHAEARLARLTATLSSREVP